MSDKLACVWERTQLLYGYELLLKNYQSLSYLTISQKIMEAEVSLPCSYERPTGLYLKSDESSSYHPNSIYLTSILILSFDLHLGFTSGLSLLLAFTPKLYMLYAFPHSCYMPCPSPPSWLDYLIISGEQLKLRSSSLCSFHLYNITSSLLTTNVPLSNMFSYALSLCPCLNIRDQVSYP
jgi:hypothetical protein